MRTFRSRRFSIEAGDHAEGAKNAPWRSRRDDLRSPVRATCRAFRNTCSSRADDIRKRSPLPEWQPVAIRRPFSACQVAVHLCIEARKCKAHRRWFVVIRGYADTQRILIFHHAFSAPAAKSHVNQSETRNGYICTLKQLSKTSEEGHPLVQRTGPYAYMPSSGSECE